jgi:hypothetical protein
LFKPLLGFLKTKSRNRAPTEENYPYTGEEDSCESYGVPKIPLNINNIYEYSLKADENKLKYHLANYGPIIITVNVDKKSGLFQHYKSGVFYDEGCRKSDDDCQTINHSMLLLGYGVTDDKKRRPYFLVQNSWVRTSFLTFCSILGLYVCLTVLLSTKLASSSVELVMNDDQFLYF